jgi:hypothetical protein
MAYAYDVSKTYQEGYLYAYTGDLDKNQIYAVINDALKPLLKRNLKIEINVVRNAQKETCGHSYLWTPEADVYQLLCGRNSDGSERIEYIDDPDWVAPEEEIDLKDVVDWGSLAQSEPLQIKVNMDPLFEFEPINDYKIGVEPAFSVENSDFQNAIVCTKVPRWVTDELLLRRFRHYENDKCEHYLKKERKKFTYPILERRKEFCKITFSSFNKKTASFVINMTKKVLFKSGDNEKLLHFSLAYKR